MATNRNQSSRNRSSVSTRRHSRTTLSSHELAHLRKRFYESIQAMSQDDFGAIRALMGGTPDNAYDEILLQFLNRAEGLRNLQSIEEWIDGQYELDDENSATGYTTLNRLLRMSIDHVMTDYVLTVRSARKRGKAVA
jgi:hypothetical protein